MKKPLKVGLLVAAGILFVLFSATAIFVATFDANQYKGAIAARVKALTGRELSVVGDLRLKLFPRVGVEVGPLALSERGSEATFASIEYAQVSLRLTPLLRKEVVAGEVTLTGARVHLKRFADGTTNIDDLLPQDSAAPAPRFDIDGVNLSRGQLRFDDEIGKRFVELSDLSLKTGRLTPNGKSLVELAFRLRADNPALDGAATLKSSLQLDLDAKRYALAGLQATLRGKIVDLDNATLALSGDLDFGAKAGRLALSRVKANVAGEFAGQKVEADVSGATAQWRANEWSAGALEGKLRLAQDNANAQAAFRVKSVSGKDTSFQVEGFSVEGAGTLQQTAFQFKASGPLAGDASRGTLQTARLLVVLGAQAQGVEVKTEVATPFALNWLTGEWRAEKLEAPVLGRLGEMQIKGGLVSMLSGNYKIQDTRLEAFRGDFSLREKALDLKVQFAGDIDAKLDRQILNSPGLTVRASGTLGGQPLFAELRGPTHVDLVSKQVTGDRLTGEFRYGAPNAKDVSLNGTVAASIGGTWERLTANPFAVELRGAISGGNLQAKLGGRLRYLLADQLVELAPMTSDLTWGTVRARLNGALSTNLALGTSGLQLEGNVDESRVQAKIGVANFAAPAYTFELSMDRLDLDRYLAMVKRVPPAAKPKRAAEIDFDALKSLNVNGTLKVGVLKSKGVTTKNARLDVKH
jgi:uncharacterized protein involved in outer membrane biogenesis